MMRRRVGIIITTTWIYYKTHVTNQAENEAQLFWLLIYEPFAHV